jgi:hypothetical protein
MPEKCIDEKALTPTPARNPSARTTRPEQQYLPAPTPKVKLRQGLKIFWKIKTAQVRYFGPGRLMLISRDLLSRHSDDNRINPSSGDGLVNRAQRLVQM